MMYDYIEHHGINGQKWGLRNGPPYPLSYKSHSTSEKRNNSLRVLSGQENARKAKQRSRNQNDASKNHLSVELTDAQKKALAKRAKQIAIAGAVVLGVGVAYTMVRNGNVNKDFVLHAGDPLYRIASSDSKEMRDVFYAATNKTDAKKYGGWYSVQKIERTLQGKWNGSDTTDIYQKIMSMKKDVKVAGTDTCRKVYSELAKNDPNFKHIPYEKFNYSLFQSKGSRDFDKSFFNALSQKGYGGLIDYNDAKLSGYTSNRPVILFGQKNNTVVNSVKKFSGSDIAKNAVVGVPAIGAQYVATNPPILAAAVGSIGTGAYVASGKKYVNDNKKKRTRK